MTDAHIPVCHVYLLMSSRKRSWEAGEDARSFHSCLKACRSQADSNASVGRSWVRDHPTLTALMLRETDGSLLFRDLSYSFTRYTVMEHLLCAGHSAKHRGRDKTKPGRTKPASDELYN